MIRIGVVEDDPVSLDRIVSHIDRYRREHGGRFQVEAFADGADLLHEYRADFDVLFLDIMMERVDGMTVARRVREVDSEVVIVFVTASPQYAISGYEVAALSYLLKPVPYSAFAQELERVLAQLRLRERRRLLLATADGSHHRVDMADILYLESAKHHVLVHTSEADYDVVTSLKAMEAELAGEGFHRCNSGYLVNLRHVIGVDGNDCRLRGGARLQISRPRKKDFLAALAAHIGERGSTA
ncbi:response regulator transcription factor [Microbacterium paludicola]|uniref:Response regulator transcription factor n=1 Tax=Microbacterium paludicola TaxID=300019 RepID=A0A4Y9FLU1_9MICO|nr:LytTR family DNA-binding domain-containing protein [Microbacterium paludicola]MBF0817705.1 response regulator transcription factor [Microbacterium paludicola]TFU30187.1 response regulator transcription factor [Microbacterium paludicola]